MEVQDLMGAMATRLREIPGIAGASYPPPSTLPGSPWIMVRLSDEPTTVEMTRLGQQTVMVKIDGLLLISASRDEVRDEAVVDRMIAPMLDCFDPKTSPTGTVGGHLPGLDGHVDRVWHTAVVTRITAEWGTTFCYGVQITYDAKFRRVLA